MKTSFENFFEKVDHLLNSLEKIHLIITEKKSFKPPSKNLSIEGTIAFLKAKGLIVSKSSIYKMTSGKSIPFKRFKNRLIFNEEELSIWTETQFKTEYESKKESIKALSNSARNKTNKKSIRYGK